MMPKTMADHLLLSSMDDLVECTKPNSIYIYIYKYIYNVFYIFYHIFMRSNYTLDDIGHVNKLQIPEGTAFCLDDRLNVFLFVLFFPSQPTEAWVKGLEASNATRPQEIRPYQEIYLGESWWAS